MQIRNLARMLAALAVPATVFLLSGCDILDRESPLDKAKANQERPFAQLPPSTQAGPAASNGEIPSDGQVRDQSKIFDEAEVILGSGQFTSARRASVDRLPSGELSLNLVDVSIQEAVNLVIGETLGASYVIDPRVNGTITVRTARPIANEDLIPTLESILAVNGAAIQQEDGLYRILPIDQAQAGFSAGGDFGYGTHILALRYVSATALKEILSSLRPAQSGNLVADAGRNVLLFTGTGREASDFMALAESFDQDWMAGMSFALEPLSVADPKTVVAELGEVFETDQGPLKGVLRFLEIERLQAVLIMSKQPAYLTQARAWVKRLDRGVEGDGRQIFVYPVKNKDAKYLASVLSQVFSADKGKDGAATLAFAPSPAAPRLEQVEVSSNGAPAAAALAGPASPAVSETTIGSIRIIADEQNNALVILSTPAEYRMIEAAVARLDIQPVQVLIEATIAEVTLKDELQYGLQWFFQSGNSSATFSTLASGAISSAFPGFSYSFATPDAKVIFNALKEVSDVRVISSPQLMVLDNKTARLQVGDQVPIATQSSVSSTNPDSPIVNSIEYKDTGVILDVTPRVNASGLVVLDIKQEVSDVTSTDTSEIDSPTIQQRQIESSVAVTSGQSIALGGMIRDRNEEGSTGLPILSDIPLLGNLFKTTANNQNRTELLVLITPRVVRNANEAHEVTEELRRRLSALEDLNQKVE